MKQAIMGVLLTGFSVFSNQVSAIEEDNLEPCINGEVSATGLFENQEAEDHYLENKLLLKVLAAEPCISGNYSEPELLENHEDKGSRTWRQ